MTWATSMPILVFLGLCSLVRPDVRDRRQTDVRPGRGIISTDSNTTLIKKRSERRKTCALAVVRRLKS